MNVFQKKIATSFALRFVLGLCVWWPSLAFGSLTWETRLIEVTPKPGAPEAIGIFNFKNTGSTPVKLTDVRPSCDCTVAEFAKREFAPGESGSVRAVFTIADRMGLQEKTINVVTDDPANPMITLTLKVDIPELLSYSGRMLHWEAGGKNSDQFIEIAPLGGSRIASVELKSISPEKQAMVRAEPMAASDKYRIIVRPVLIDQPRTISVTMLVRFADGAQHSFAFFALVR